jgi:hypothetical protein
MNHLRIYSMKPAIHRSARLALVVCCSAALANAAAGDNQAFRAIKPLATTASWDVPQASAVREAALAFLVLAEARELWPAENEATNVDVLDRFAAAVALVEPKAGEVLNYAKGAGPATPWPHAPWLTDDKTPAIVRNNLRLLAARRLVEARRFDDVLDALQGVDVGDVADPAALLFARAVAEHQLVRPQACAATAATLLENERLIPTRYAVVARLLRADIEGVEHGSLDDIARRMDNVGRRIELGQAGRRTNDLAAEVVKSLDELIEEEEKRRREREPRPGRGHASGKPADESRPLEGKGAGKVDHKSIGSGRGWGNLPAKVRDAALQQIGKDFPAHYREIIEEYFRRLAAEEE